MISEFSRFIFILMKRDDLTNHDCAALLLYVAEAATKVALEGIQILGGNGYSKFAG